MSYTVYILHSKLLNKFYIGHTGDLIGERVRCHLSDHRGFTSKAKDWQLVYPEIFVDKTDAANREHEIKNPPWNSRRAFQIKS